MAAESFRERLRRLRKDGAAGAETRDTADPVVAPSAASENTAPRAASESAELRAASESAEPRTANECTELRAASESIAPSAADSRATPALAQQLTRHAERRTRHLARTPPRTELRTELRTAELTPPAPGRARNVTFGAPADLARADESGVLARRRVYAREHAHGAYTLGEVAHADSAAFALCARDPALAHVPLMDALYLDTETTGLSGGAGTYVFLVGLGSFTPAGFEVWQGFLADPAHERALLAEVAERIARAPLLVTFFGKSFDRHRLEDKMRMHGVTPPFTGKPHLDLYHPLRRLYGASLPDARLRTMEHALCGVERPDDLPGSFAPAAWFDFLAGRAHLLEGVFAHNADDVLSLVTLGAHAGRVTHGARASGECLGGAARDRELALVRLHAEARDFERAFVHLERACAASGTSEDLALARAQLLMSARRMEEAHVLLGALASTTSSQLGPRIFLCLARTALAMREAPQSIIAHLAHAERELDQRWTGREHARGMQELALLRARVERRARVRTR